MLPYRPAQNTFRYKLQDFRENRVYSVHGILLHRDTANSNMSREGHMSAIDAKLKNEILDDIILSRRTIRGFRSESPEEDMVRQVINAGLHAPYAKAEVEKFTDGYFRRFFVLRAGSDSMATASACLNEKVKELDAELEEKGKADPVVAEKSHSWANRLKWFQDLGHLPGVTNAPYFIIIAEYRGMGIPDLGQHALAHCLQNMWLKATALDLAFQIVSVTSEMGNDTQFCGLLGLKPGEWDLMGCALGYAKKTPGPSRRPSVDEITVWLP